MAKAKITTNPNVFIIESLDWDDEENNRFEGRLLISPKIKKRSFYEKFCVFK